VKTRIPFNAARSPSVARREGGHTSAETDREPTTQWHRRRAHRQLMRNVVIFCATRCNKPSGRCNTQTSPRQARHGHYPPNSLVTPSSLAVLGGESGAVLTGSDATQAAPTTRSVRTLSILADFVSVSEPASGKMIV